MTESLQTYSIASWNVAGVTSDTNLSILKDTIRAHGIEILCLQEVSFHDFYLYNYTFYLNSNSPTKNCVAFVIRNDIMIHDLFHHPQGRLSRVIFEHFALVNIYAHSGHNNRQAREAFFLHEVSCALFQLKVPGLLAGDMNCVLSPNDCTSQMTFSVTLNDLISTFELRDIWRIQHPTLRQYTYHYSTGASRLDRIYIPHHLVPYCSQCYIAKLAISDHCLLVMKCNFPATKHFRPSYNWKLNNVLLKNDDYQLIIRQAIQDIKDNNRYSNQNAIQRWLSIKKKLIYLTKQYSRDLAILRQEQFAYYHKILNNLAKRLHTDRTLLPEVKLLQSQLKQLYSTRLRGLIIRSRLPHFPEVEASLIHIKAIKQRSQNFINTYVLASGISIQGEPLYHALHDDFNNHFSQLDTQSNFPSFSTLPLKTLPVDASLSLLDDITEQEIDSNLRTLNAHASPGMDGLTVDWYQLFFHDLSSFLQAAYTYVFSHSSIPPEFGDIQGIVIPKTPSRISFNSVRFLSIYNVDFKLYAKILVSRLKPVIPAVLHPSQFGLPGGAPLHLVLGQIRDLLQYQKISHSRDYVLLCTDLSRAFDTLSLSFLYHVLQILGFPPPFINALRHIYSLRRIILKINGRFLPKIKMATGLSQGCPLSSIMFSLAMTPLIYTLQANLQGLTIQRTPLSVFSYIDDITSIVHSPDEAYGVLLCFQHYGQMAGIHLNIKKSRILCLSPHQSSHYASLCPTTTEHKILGIYWTASLSTTVTINAKVIISSMVSTLQRYKHTFHTLQGRIAFINLYVFSKCYYFLQILPFHEQHYALIRKFIGYFIWHTSCLRISHNTLLKSKSSGGLNLKNLKIQGQALRLNRLLHVICNHADTLSYDFTQLLLGRITPTAPLNIQHWQHLTPLLADIYIEVSYLLIAHTPIDNFTTRLIYQTLFSRHDGHIPKIQEHFPGYDWQCIFNNLQFVSKITDAFDIWYRLIHNIIPLNQRLYELGISSSAECSSCHQIDDLRHRITTCNSNHLLWTKYLYMVSILLHTSPRNLSFDDLIRFPAYRYFPPRKKKFLLWLTANTLDIALHSPGDSLAQCYQATLQFRLQNIPMSHRLCLFDQFSKVLYM